MISHCERRSGSQRKRELVCKCRACAGSRALRGRCGTCVVGVGARLMRTGAMPACSMQARVATLTLLLALAPDCARGLLSSAGPEDLLATPRYVLSFSGAPISNASAAEMLATDDGRGQYHRMRSATGQAFVCSVPTPPKAPAVVEPVVVMDEQTKLARRTKRDQDRRSGLERGLALLEPLKGTCLHLRQGWFTCAARLHRATLTSQTHSAMASTSANTTRRERPDRTRWLRTWLQRRTRSASTARSGRS